VSEFNSQLPRSYEDPDAANALFFSSDTEYYWRHFRLKRFGESNRALTLLPMTKNGARHDVVWLERSWVDPNSDRAKTVHHAACRCLVESDLNGDDEFEAMQKCSALQAGILYRSLEVNHQLGLDFGQMLAKSAELSDVEHEGINFHGMELDPVDEAMLFHLRTIKRQPQYWEGNVWGGEHQLHLLSVVTGFEVGQLAEHALALAENGWVDYDGDQTVRLAA